MSLSALGCQGLAAVSEGCLYMLCLVWGCSGCYALFGIVLYCNWLGLEGDRAAALAAI